MTISYSLIPPGTDISVGLLNSLLGTGWESLATGTAGPQGTGVIIAQLLAILNVALLGFISALVMYQTTLGAMMTAHEGTPLGKKYHSIFAPIRGPLAFLMATPLPMAKGLSLLQVTLLFCIHMSIGIADSVWSAFVDNAPTQSYTAMQGMDTAANVKFVNSVIYNEVIKEFLIKENGATFQNAAWSYAPDSIIGASGGTETLREIPADQSVGKNLGAVSIRCSTAIASVPTNPATIWSEIGGAVDTLVQADKNVIGGSPADSEACQSEMKTIDAVRRAAVAIADHIIAVGTSADTNVSQPATQQPVISTEIATLQKQYSQAQTANAALVAQATGTVLQQQEADFAATAKQLGWASSIFYYWKMSNIQQQSALQTKTLYPDVTPPDMVNVNNSTVGIEPYIAVTNSLIGLVNQRALEGANGTSGFDGVSKNNESGFSGIAASSIKSLTAGNPVINFATWGNDAIDTGETMVAGSAVLGIASTAVGAASKAVPANPESAVAGTVSSVVGGLAKLMFCAAIFLIIQGFFGAYVIPSMPSFIMLAAVASWVVLVLELLVAAPLWAAAHAFAAGDGITSQESKQGYGIAMGIIFRPVLLTLGFIFSFLLITVFGNFTGGSLSMFFSTLTAGQVVGPITAIAIITITLAATLMIMKFVFTIGIHLAENVPKWIGGIGASLGETGRAETSSNTAVVAIANLKNQQPGQSSTGMSGGGVAAGKTQTAGKKSTVQSPADSLGSTTAKPAKKD